MLSILWILVELLTITILFFSSYWKLCKNRQFIHVGDVAFSIYQGRYLFFHRYLLFIVLSVLFMDSDYSFGIFKLFLHHYILKLIFLINIEFEVNTILMYAVCKVTSLYWSGRYHFGGVMVCIVVDLGTSLDQVISKTKNWYLLLLR